LIGGERRDELVLDNVDRPVEIFQRCVAIVGQFDAERPSLLQDRVDG